MNGVDAGSRESGVKVLLVDDHEVVQWGVRLMLSQEQWVERCLVCSGLEEAVSIAQRYQPHVALTDLVLRDTSGPDVAQAVREVSPYTRVLFFSGARIVGEPTMRATGAFGFVDKSQPPADIALAVRMVARGMRVSQPDPDSLLARLSDREASMLTLIAGGATNREIGERMFLSPNTVKDNASAIFRKLGARNRTDAVRRARECGIA